LARFGEADENSPHQCLTLQVVKILGNAIVWVVLRWFVVARIARRVGVAFWVTS
jgi:hypothetical protein